MEKWAKTLNQKAKGQPVVAAPASVAASTTPTSASNVSSPAATMASMSGSQVHSVTIGKSTEDLAFSMLQNKKDSGLNNESSASGLSKLSGYGSDSGPETEDQEVNLDEQQFTDWSKLACLLCKRQFPSREKLTK